jgi:hypothetical protein
MGVSEGMMIFGWCETMIGDGLPMRPERDAAFLVADPGLSMTFAELVCGDMYSPALLGGSDFLLDMVGGCAVKKS